MLDSLDDAHRAINAAARDAPKARGLARDLAAAVRQEAAAAAGVRIIDLETLANIGWPAIEGLRAFLLSLTATLDARLAPIRAALIEHHTAQNAARETALEARALRAAEGMSAHQALDWIKSERRAVVRLKGAKIEIAPAGLAHDISLRGILRMHYGDIVEILRERGEFAVVEPIAPITERE